MFQVVWNKNVFIVCLKGKNFYLNIIVIQLVSPLLSRLEHNLKNKQKMIILCAQSQQGRIRFHSFFLFPVISKQKGQKLFGAKS